MRFSHSKNASQFKSEGITDGDYVYAVYAKSLELARETVAALQTAAAKRASAQAASLK